MIFFGTRSATLEVASASIYAAARGVDNIGAAKRADERHFSRISAIFPRIAAYAAAGDQLRPLQAPAALDEAKKAAGANSSSLDNRLSARLGRSAADRG